MPFSTASAIFAQDGLIAARSGNLGGFKPGDVFYGKPGQISKITDNGNTLIDPWVTLPGETGNFEEGLAFDETGIFGGNLLAATTSGGIWKIDVNGQATKLAQTPYRLDGLTVIPDNARYGPLAGKLVAVITSPFGGLATVDPQGNVATINLSHFVERGIHLIVPNENFFAVNRDSGRLLGAAPDGFAGLAGEILLTHVESGNFMRLYWDGTSFKMQVVNFDTGSFRLLFNALGTNFTGTAGAGTVPTLDLEDGLPSWTVYLDINQNGTRDVDEPFTVTDANGKYSFANVSPGTHTVALDGQSGFKLTRPAGGSYTVTVAPGHDVSGLDFGTSPDDTQRGPKFTSSPPTRTTVGQFITYQAVVSNPGGQPLQFDLPLRPTGMAVEPNSGKLVWQASVAEFGPQHVILRVRDDQGHVDLQAFTIDVDLSDSAPVITSSPPTPAIVGLPYQYQVIAQDAENDPLAYHLTTFPAGMTIDAATGRLTYTPTAAQVGTQVVTVQVSDGQGGTTTQSFDLLVVASAANDAPVITSTPRTVVGIGANYFYQVAASDPNADPLTYTLVASPNGMTIDAAGLVRWTPAASQLGANPVALRVEDGRGGVATQSFTIQVNVQNSNQAPRIVSTPNEVATVAQPYAYDAQASDPDGDPVYWDFVKAPDGLSIDPQRGTLRWTPTVDDASRKNDVTLRVTDSFGASSVQTFTIGVGLGNVPPAIMSLPLTQGAVNHLYAYTPRAINIYGDPLTFALTTAPAGMTIIPSADPLDGEIADEFGDFDNAAIVRPQAALIQWTPTAGQVGPQDVVLQVSDQHGNLTTQSWTVIVTAIAPNLPPSIPIIPPQVATVNMPYAHQMTAIDPENETLHFLLQGEPAGMTIDANTGLIQWTPTVAQLGKHFLNIAVIDPEGAIGVLRTSINVLATNQAPTITSAPITTATAGAPYDYDVHVVDPDDDPIDFTLTTGPAGMTIDALGRLTWLPGAADLGAHPVEVAANDGRGGVVSQQFTVTVTSDTDAPRP